MVAENPAMATAMPTIAHTIAFFAVSIFPGSPLAVKNKNPAQMNMMTEMAKKIGHTTIFNNLFATPINHVAGSMGSVAKANPGKTANANKTHEAMIFLFIYEKSTLLIIIGIEIDKSATTTPIDP